MAKRKKPNNDSPENNGQGGNPAPEPEPTKPPEPAAEATPSPAPAPSVEPPTAAPAVAVDTYSAERLAMLIKAAKKTRKAKNIALRDKAKAKASKAAWEAALEYEHELTITSEQRAFKLGEDPDTIDADEPAEAEAEPTEAEAEASSKARPGGVERKPITPIDPSDDSWKTVALSNLGIRIELHSSILKSLGDSDLLTVGDLARWTQPKPAGKGKLLTDIAGIGESKAAAIDHAMMEFWQVRSGNAIASDSAGDPATEGKQTAEPAPDAAEPPPSDGDSADATGAP